MKNIKLIVLLVVIGLAFLNQKTFAQTVDERINRALAAINKNDFDSAMTDINEILKAQPENTTAFYLRGIINYKKNNFDQAIADQSKAIQLNTNPKFVEFYYERGIAYQNKPNPDYKAALADFNHAIENAPNYRDAYYARGFDNMKLENWTAAESDFTQAINYGKNDKFVYINRGATRYNLANYDQAIADFRKSLELDPNWDVAKSKLEATLKVRDQNPGRSDTDGLSAAELLKRADDAKKSGDAANQEKYLTAAIKADPKNYNAYEERAFLYHAAKKDDLALADCQQLINPDPNNLDGYYIRADFYKDLKDYARAIPDYTSLLNLKLTSDQSAKIYYSRGIAYEKNFQYDEAVNDFTKATSLNPNAADAYFERATIYQGQGNYDLAEADLKKILKIKPADKAAQSELDEIKMLKKIGFNVDHSSGDSLLRILQYLENVTEMEKVYFQKFSLATTKITQDPKATAEICSLTADANLTLKKIEINVAGINQIAGSGKIDKLEDIKKGALDVIKDYPGYRNGINKLAIEHGCKLD